MLFSLSKWKHELDIFSLLRRLVLMDFSTVCWEIDFKLIWQRELSNLFLCKINGGLNYDKNFSFWSICNWRSSIWNVWNIECFVVIWNIPYIWYSIYYYSIFTVWLFNLYFQTLLVNIIEILPVRTFDLSLRTSARFAFFILRIEKVNEKNSLKFEYITTDWYKCWGQLDMKVRMSLSRREGS